MYMMSYKRLYIGIAGIISIFLKISYMCWENHAFPLSSIHRRRRNVSRKAKACTFEHII